MLGDRYSRPKLIAFGVAVWSLATAAGGLAASFASLFAARASVGIGEAAYGTIAPALIADYFPARMRGRVFALFFCAIPVGSALGYVLGGFVNHHYGWRAAFFVAGIPGLLLAALTLGVPDPPRGSEDIKNPPRGSGDMKHVETQHASRTRLRDYLSLGKNKMYAGTVLGYAAYTFAPRRASRSGCRRFSSACAECPPSRRR